MPLSFLAPLPISRLPARLDVSPRRPRSIPVAVSRPTPPPPPPPPPSQKDPLKDESAASSATRDDTPDKLSNIQIFGERLRDTVGDAYVHYARIAGAQRRGSRSFDSDDGESVGAGRVVVLGSGWGAHSLVKVVDMNTVTSLVRCTRLCDISDAGR